MSAEKLKEALVLVKKAQEAVEECLEEYGGEEYEPKAKPEEGDSYENPPGDRMSKMLSMMGKRK